jgi:hypothetical protein
MEKLFLLRKSNAKDVAMVPPISHSVVNQDDQLATVTTYQGAISLRIHAIGFIELSVIGIRAAMEHKTAIDSITPSIIYAIRHGTELFLKYVIVDLANKHDGRQISMQTPSGHSLLPRFIDARDKIAFDLDSEATHGEHSNFNRHEWLSHFEEIVRTLNDVDPDGQTLRYPANKKGDPNLGGTLTLSLLQVETFAISVGECFSRYAERCC